MQNVKHNSTGKQGMTLVELVIFMTLTLFVFGGVIRVVLQSSRLDKASEERTAAFFFCKSVLEGLHRIPFEDLTASGSGFHKQGVNLYVRKNNDVPFHTSGGARHTVITADELVELRYGSTGESTNCMAMVKLTWQGSGSSGSLSESASAILYP